MKRILIPTDFSVDSKHALDYMLNLLQETQIPSNILLLNTYMTQQKDALVDDQLKKKSKEGLTKAKEEALKGLLNPNISIETASQMGTLNHVILQLLKKEKVDLVVMGKDGGKHVESVAALLKKEQRPLLITYLKKTS